MRTEVICLTAVHNRLICGQDLRTVLLGDKRDTLKNVVKSKRNQPEMSNEIRRTIQSILCTIAISDAVTGGGGAVWQIS